MNNDAYWKLVKCAYEMAMEPTMPHRHFKVLVKCVKANGVRLFERSENGRTGREFIHCIAEAVKEKCTLIERWQSEKQNQRINLSSYSHREKWHSSIYSEKFGGGSTDAIVKGINWAIQALKRRIPRETCKLYRRWRQCQHRKVLWSPCANETQPIMALTIHCANRRVELAVKSSLSIVEFEAVEEFYKKNFQLLKNSGKIKAQVAECARNLGIHYYPMPKIHGTRFVNHRRRGFKNLLETWPAYTLAYENAVTDP